MKANLNNFVTLTFSGNGNYYGLTADEVTRVMGKNKIPIFRMTLDAFLANTTKVKSSDLQSKSGEPHENTIRNGKSENGVHLTRANNIICNALYITVPSISQLERRLKYSAFSSKEQSQKVEKAKNEEKEALKYFSQEDIIGQYEEGREDEGAFDENLMRIKSRLF